MTNNEIVTAGLKAGHSKNQIITDLVRSDPELDLVAAGSLYKEVGSSEGFLLNKDAKEALVAEVIAQYTTEDEGVVSVDREKIVNSLVERGHMSKNAATNQLKTHCAAHEIEFPSADRSGGGRDMVAVKAAYKTWWEEGIVREQIEAGLIEHFKYTENSAKSAYLKLGKELGFIEEGVAQGRQVLAEWFANPEKVKGEKKDIVALLIEETGVAKATAETRYGAYLFAKAYHNAMTTPAE